MLKRLGTILHNMKWIKSWRSTIYIGLVLVALALINSSVYYRIDLTEDKRFTLAHTTRQMLTSLPATLYVKSYLGGELPLEFARLRNAMQELLEEYRIASGQRIIFSHEDPNSTEDPRERAFYHEQLIKEGISPVNTQERTHDGSVVERLIFPALSVSYKGRVAHSSIYNEDITLSVSENIDNAIQSAEFILSSTIMRLLREHKEQLVILEGRGCAHSSELAALERLLLRDFDLRRSPLDTLVGAWDNCKVAILPGPTAPLSETEKLAIDQYVMGGGRLLLAVNPILVGLDTLQIGQQTLAYATDQNLGDLLFRWGFRIPPVLVQDMQCALLPVNTALAGQAARFIPSPWPYFPLLTPNPSHLVTRNVNLVYSRFPSHVEVLQKADSATSIVPLLTTSPYARTVLTPKFVDLQEMLSPPRPEEMSQGPLAVGVTKQGQFSSLYKHRPIHAIAPGQQFALRTQSPVTRIALLSDPSILTNETRNRNGKIQILPLGFDKYTQQTFGNAEFATNLVYYLAGYDDLLSLRNRELSIRILNHEECTQHRQQWQWMSVLIPIALFILIGLTWRIARWYRYGKAQT